MARRLAPVLVLAAALALVAPASAERYVAVRGAPGPGPARYDRVWVHEFGPASAKRVLVLVPGYIGGSGDFTLVARELVARVPGLSVWALDRREQAFEDTSVFATGDLQAAYDYYLGFRPVGGRSFTPVDGRNVTFVRRWGLPLALEDLRRVVLRARDGGRRKVILGGHSLGASSTVAYAAWDFAGHPGYRDIEGMVLIDGGLLGTFMTPSYARVRQRLAALNRGDPFVSVLPGLPPWAAGVFAEIGGLYAVKAPQAPSALQDYALLPASVRPPVRVTNQGLLGYALDETTSPPGLETLRVRAGALAPAGDPRPWQDGEVSTVERLAQMLSQEPGNGVDWYFPVRLTLDVDGASTLPGRGSRMARLLDLRTVHERAIDVPLYAFQTDLTKGRVLRGARRLERASRIPNATYIDASSSTSHLDPLTATPERSSFLKTVVPFLKRLR